jgi:hypothetical protein
LDLLGAVGAPLGKAALQLRPGGRRDENAHRIRPLAGNLDGALHLDVQDHVLALVQRLVHKFLGGAVEVAHILGVLQKLVPGDPLPKGVDVQKMIMNAVDLAGAGLPRGGGDGEIDVLPAVQQGPQNGALSDPGGAGDDEGSSFAHALCFLLR